METNKELDVLQPVDFVEVKGEKVYIRPFHFTKLNSMLSVIKRLGPGFFEALQNMEVEPNTKNVAWTPNTMVAITGLYETNQKDIIELVSFFIDRDEKWFYDEEKGPDVFEGIAMVVAVVMKNFDFFMNNLLPMMGRMFRAAKATPEKKKAPGRK